MKKLLLLAGVAAIGGAANAGIWNVDAGGPINDVSTQSFRFTVSGEPTSITDINVRFSVQHTFDNDLDVSLTSPGGTTINLFTDVGGSGDNFQDTYLDDGNPTIGSTGNNTAPFASTEWGGRSYGIEIRALLSAYNGQNPNGTWTLTVVDDLGGDVGVLYRTGESAPWGTAIGTQLIITAVPEPATMLALGAGLAALAARRRRK